MKLPGNAPKIGESTDLLMEVHTLLMRAQSTLQTATEVVQQRELEVKAAVDWLRHGRITRRSDEQLREMGMLRPDARTSDAAE